ncbi:hypothetical protein HN873_071567 [Arachis hypogaea]
MASSHSVTDGVYKVRERIHRRMADWRLLAIPASQTLIFLPPQKKISELFNIHLLKDLFVTNGIYERLNGLAIPHIGSKGVVDGQQVNILVLSLVGPEI